MRVDGSGASCFVHVVCPEPRPSLGITVAPGIGLSDATLGIVTEVRAGHGRLAAVHTWVGLAHEPTTCHGAVVALPETPMALQQLE